MPYEDFQPNRVTNSFPDLVGRNELLLVNFVDLEGKITKDLNNYIDYEWFFKLSMKKFFVADREYKLLGFSQSQLRNYSFWAISVANDIPKMLSFFGDFSKYYENKYITKYCAYLGLLFTSIKDEIKNNKNDFDYTVEVIPDFCKNKYIFSDGCGEISKNIIEKIRENMNLNKEISAIQVRIGGAKGMLSIDPYSRNKIYLRPSMVKFESNEKSLNIIKYAYKYVGYFNTELIILLASRGIKQSVIKSYYDTYLDMIRNIKKSNKDAYKILSYDRNLDNRNLCLPLLYEDIPLSEPFVNLYINNIVLYEQVQISKKFRILINNSVRLMGIIDPYNVLEEGEIFVQFYLKENEKQLETNPKLHVYRDVKFNLNKAIINSKVTILKNPALHAGDLRTVHAVEHEALYHYCDVVVFSQKGERSLTDSLSGSDLDGDEYLIIFDDNLIPSTPNFEPADYRKTEEPLKNEINDENIYDFFCYYMKTDSLGMICKTWEVYADKNGLNVNNDVCRKIHNIHSHTVDFGKTGKFKNLDKSLILEEYPDFQEKRKYVNYKSKTLLGEIYRSCKSLTLEGRESHVEKKEILQYFVRPGYQKHTDFVESIVKMYEFKINSILKTYDITSEIEFVSKNINFKFNRKHSDRDKLDLIFNSLKHDMEFKVNEYVHKSTAHLEEVTVYDEYKIKDEIASCLYIYINSRDGFKSVCMPWILFKNNLLYVYRKNRNKIRYYNYDKSGQHNMPTPLSSNNINNQDESENHKRDAVETMDLNTSLQQNQQQQSQMIQNQQPLPQHTPHVNPRAPVYSPHNLTSNLQNYYANQLEQNSQIQTQLALNQQMKNLVSSTNNGGLNYTQKDRDSNLNINIERDRNSDAVQLKMESVHPITKTNTNSQTYSSITQITPNPKNKDTPALSERNKKEKGHNIDNIDKIEYDKDIDIVGLEKKNKQIEDVTFETPLNFPKKTNYPMPHINDIPNKKQNTLLQPHSNSNSNSNPRSHVAMMMEYPNNKSNINNNIKDNNSSSKDNLNLNYNIHKYREKDNKYNDVVNYYKQKDNNNNYDKTNASKPNSIDPHHNLNLIGNPSINPSISNIPVSMSMTGPSNPISNSNTYSNSNALNLNYNQNNYPIENQLKLGYQEQYQEQYQNQDNKLKQNYTYEYQNSSLNYKPSPEEDPTCTIDAYVNQANKHLFLNRKLGEYTVYGNSIADRFSMFCILPLRLVLDQGVNFNPLQREKHDIFLFVSNCNYDNVSNLVNFLYVRSKKYNTFLLVPNEMLINFKLAYYTYCALMNGSKVENHHLSEIRADRYDFKRLTFVDYVKEDLNKSFFKYPVASGYYFKIIKTNYLTHKSKDGYEIKNSLGFILYQSFGNKYVPEIAYSIDTSYEYIIKYNDFLTSKLIILDSTEMRVATDEQEKVIGENTKIFRNFYNYRYHFKNKENRYIILTHFGGWLHKEQILTQFNEMSWQDRLKKKVILWVK